MRRLPVRGGGGRGGGGEGGDGGRGGGRRGRGGDIGEDEAGAREREVSRSCSFERDKEKRAKE